MLRSMTAYGRACGPTSMGRLVVEIQSVNRRFLEIQVFVPELWSIWEPRIRGWIQGALSRGVVKVRVSLEGGEVPLGSPRVNEELVAQFAHQWRSVCTKLDIPLSSEALFQVLGTAPGVMAMAYEGGNEEEFGIELNALVDQALEQLKAHREVEGRALWVDMDSHLEQMERMRCMIAEKAHGATEKARTKLMGLLDDCVPHLEGNRDLLLREVALLAEKYDFSEELIRLESHIRRFRELVSGSGASSVGKTLDFLLQEMLRETNTIGSKANDADIAHHVVEVKSEIEKVREQVQNVE